jgi:hypothetical protein
MNKEIIFSAKEYKEKYNDLLETYLLEYEDYEEIDFINIEIESYKKHIVILDELEKTINDTSEYKLNSGYIENLLNTFELLDYENCIDYNKRDRSILSFNKIIKFLELQKQNPIQTPTKTKTNKSLLFEGKDLNLSERFKIANKVLDIDKKIRTLNIKELEKYQLLAYILGCDKDNARNLMNGSYNSKDRDLTNYFNDLDLNK